MQRIFDTVGRNYSANFVQFHIEKQLVYQNSNYEKKLVASDFVALVCQLDLNDPIVTTEPVIFFCFTGGTC